MRENFAIYSRNDAPYKIYMRVTCASIENTEHVRRLKCPEAFCGADRGIKVISELLKSKDKEHVAAKISN